MDVFKSRRSTAAWHHYFVALGSLVLTIGFLYWARTVLMPLVLAALLSFILMPLVGVVQRAGLGRVLSALFVVGIACGLAAAVGLLVLGQVRSLANELPQHTDTISQKILKLQEASKDSWLSNLTDSLNDITARVNEQKKEGTEPLPVQVQTSGLVSILQQVANPAVEFLVNIGFVILLLTFILIQRENLRNRLIRLCSNGDLTSMTHAMDDAGRRISRFLQMQLAVNGTYGLAMAIGMYFLGVPYAFLWGVLAALLRYIPYLGPWLAAAFPLFITLAVVPGWTPLVLVLVYIVVLELISNNVMEPILYGASIGVSEVALLVAAAFWGWLWGPVGLLLSVPLTACLAVVGRYVPRLEFLEVLLGDEQVLEPAVVYYQRLLARDEFEAAELIEDLARQHSPEHACQKVLLPALALVEEHQQRGKLSREDADFILEATRRIMDEEGLTRSPSTIASELDKQASSFLACPARTRGEEVALEAFGGLLDPQPAVISADVLTAEITAMAAERPKSLLFILALSRASLPHVRHLCKRVRQETEVTRIFIGCWGLNLDVDKTRERMRAAGANEISFSSDDSITQLRSVLLINQSNSSRPSTSNSVKGAQAASHV